MLVVLSAVFLLVWFFFFSPAGSSQEKVALTIPEGATVSRIAELLAARRVVKSSLVFRLLADYRKVGTTLMAGEYQLREGMTYEQAFKALEKGPIPRVFNVTIPEGLTIEQTSRLVASRTKIDYQGFRELAENRALFNYGFLADVPAQTLEGYVFPKTYTILRDADARSLIELMLVQFDRETEGLDWRRAEARGLTPFQVIIIASLVEKEAKVARERELVSAVIYNRIRAGIPLQIDATVQYALPARKDKLTYDDLKINSPYNTYLNKGLPPGPICSPGIASIRAALEPAQVDYLYYLVTGKDGSHTFTSSYQEFLRLKQQVKRNGG